ncbi:MAG TPA: inositol monophosphatase family protein [Acidimicrobiales bacterium]|nr:inositol monophosphatase family protein [Acidimicrobiales bacterium]
MSLLVPSAAVVRLAEWSDLGAVAELIERMGGHEGVARRPGTATSFGAALDRPESRALVAVVAGRVVGFAELHVRPSTVRGVRQAWVGTLAVDESHRRSGVGASLVHAIDREASRLGCDEVVLESGAWRHDAHRFYESLGFSEHQTSARRFGRPVREPLHVGLVSRFLAAAARAAEAAAGAVAGWHHGPVAPGADGAPASGADQAAEEAAMAHLAPLGLTVMSEEGGQLVRAWSAAEPWICLDPLDGSRNHRRRHPPWATAVGLVHGGQPIAGFVLDHTSGRRWWAASGSGAWVDGRPARPRSGGLVAVPSVSRADVGRLRLPPGYERARMSGSTTIDLCRVADGSLGAFVDLDRAVVHPHDLAGPLAVLVEAGAAVARPDGRPLVVEPDPSERMHLVAASDHAALADLLAGRRTP